MGTRHVASRGNSIDHGADGWTSATVSGSSEFFETISNLHRSSACDSRDFLGDRR